MKKRSSRSLSFVLVFVLLAAILSVGVFAAVDVPEVSCELGTALDYTIPQEGGDNATGFEVLGGNLPAGVSVTLSGGAIKLVGTPGASGTYNYQIRISNADGSEEYHLTLKVTEPAPTPTPSPSPTPTPSPTPAPKPVITKPPYSETKLEGEYAIFIAHADNADTVEWRIQSPDGKTEYDVRDIGKYFAGASAEGYTTDTMTIYNIRREMDGWKVRAKFIGDGGSAFTDTATITVERGGLVQPSITRDPFVTSDSDTLSVTASDPNKGVLHYQWYSSADNSNANADGTDVAIPGANSAAYVPPETPGTVYYYCAVWSTLEGEQSEAAKSRVVAVSHPEPEPTPAPTPEPTLVPTTETPAPSGAPDADARADAARRSGSKFLLILMGVLILALIAAAVALVIISRKEKQLEQEEEDAAEAAGRERSIESARQLKNAPAEAAAVAVASASAAPEAPKEEPPIEAPAAAAPAERAPLPETRGAHEAPAAADSEADDPDSFVLDGWYCAKCGTFNRGRSCSACGEQKPDDAVQYVCDHCGWENPDPEHPPRFCPDCGAPFAAADK